MKKKKIVFGCFILLLLLCSMISAEAGVYKERVDTTLMCDINDDIEGYTLEEVDGEYYADAVEEPGQDNPLSPIFLIPIYHLVDGKLRLRGGGWHCFYLSDGQEHHSRVFSSIKIYEADGDIIFYPFSWSIYGWSGWDIPRRSCRYLWSTESVDVTPIDYVEVTVTRYYDGDWYEYSAVFADMPFSDSN